MIKIIDLTHPIVDGMEVFPGDPVVSVRTHNDYGNGYFVSQFSMGTHTGTHVDAPVHRIPGGKAISDLKIEQFIGWHTYVLDLSNLQPGQEITRELLKAHMDDMRNCDGLLLRTGWAKKWGAPEFFIGFPSLHEDCADFFVEQGIHIIGTEAPSVHSERHLSVHDSLLKKEITVVESVANLEKLDKKYVAFYAVPLLLQQRDGSPVRAFAVQKVM